MKNRGMVIVLWIFFFWLTMYLGNVYRPYIYQNNIEDYGLADVGYNIIAVVNMSLLSWTGFYRFTSNKIVDIGINTGAYLFVELMSYFTNSPGVFDIKDCIALILSGLFSLLLLHLIDKEMFVSERNKIYLKLNQQWRKILSK